MLNLSYVGPVPDMTDSVIWVSLTKRTIKERTDETHNLFKENFLGTFLLQIFFDAHQTRTKSCIGNCKRILFQWCHWLKKVFFQCSRDSEQLMARLDITVPQILVWPAPDSRLARKAILARTGLEMRIKFQICFENNSSAALAQRNC